MSTTTARDVCARRGIVRVVHCHADHFEPEAAVAKSIGSGADVEQWLAAQRPAIPTLFVKPPIGFRLDPSSEIGMSLYMSSSTAIEADYLRRLVALGVGIGLHIHHEAWTCNTVPREKLSPSQQTLHDYAMTDPQRDHARMRAMTAAALSWLRETTGMPLETWGFVHGCWAFGASDPEICTLRDELPLLYSLGCRADFSFPAGRRYCDPGWDRPKWVRPATGLRAYELGDPRYAPAADRMLVWASRCDDWWLGLDTYSEDSRKLTESTDKIERYMALCPVIDGTAYIKTCAHGMNVHYWKDGPASAVGAFARKLADVGVPVEFLTTEQATRELIDPR